MGNPMGGSPWGSPIGNSMREFRVTSPVDAQHPLLSLLTRMVRSVHLSADTKMFSYVSCVHQNLPLQLAMLLLLNRHCIALPIIIQSLHKHNFTTSTTNFHVLFEKLQTLIDNMYMYVLEALLLQTTLTIAV